jgi:hypothetical protein
MPAATDDYLPASPFLCPPDSESSFAYKLVAGQSFSTGTNSPTLQE